MIGNATSPPSETTPLSDREFRLSEEKARSDQRLKERELELKERELTLTETERRLDRELTDKELQLKRRELAVGRWSGPVAVAIVAGVLGIVGTFFSASENRELERKKQEGTLLLEAIRTGGSGKEREQQAAANLVFLADAGLVSLGKDQLDKLRQRAGDATPGLPTATAAVQARIPDAIRQRILKSFDDFAAYFQGIGAKNTPKVQVDTVPPDVPGTIAYYDPGKSTVHIDVQYLTDINVPLREYAHAVLYADGKLPEIDFERTWNYVAIESGLASYFPSSFVNDPRVPGVGDKETLDNARSLKELKPSSTIMWDGIYVWGGAFWELRKVLGKVTCDKVLYTAWQSLQGSDLKKNDPRDFVGNILKADSALQDSRHDSQIRALFRRRGMEL